MASKKRKQRVRRFLVIKEIVMVALAILCLAGLVLEHLEHLTEAQLYVLKAFEIIVGLIFIAEFAFELYHAKDRGKYWRHHWYFLLAAVPLPTQTFDILRGIRILRLLRLFKIFAHLRYENNTWLADRNRA